VQPDLPRRSHRGAQCGAVQCSAAHTRVHSVDSLGESVAFAALRIAAGDSHRAAITVRPSPCGHHRAAVTAAITVRPSPRPSLCGNHRGHHRAAITVRPSPRSRHRGHHCAAITAAITVRPSLCGHHRGHHCAAIYRHRPTLGAAFVCFGCAAASSLQTDAVGCFCSIGSMPMPSQTKLQARSIVGHIGTASTAAVTTATKG
jgi:hypothetical protein